MPAFLRAASASLVRCETQDMTSTIMATVLGLAAQIEREFVSQRTKEALAARKKAGMVLGRPPGPAARHKLDDRRKDCRAVSYTHLTLPTTPYV